MVNYSLYRFLAEVTGQRVIMPFYHAVADHVPVHLKHLFHVRSTKQFKNDLDFLFKHYQPISLADLIQHANGEKTISQPSFFLSFDDGLREFKEYAWPVLKQKGIRATLFINSGFVDNLNLFFRFKASIIIEFIRENRNSDLLMDALKHSSHNWGSIETVEKSIRNTGYKQTEKLDNLAGLLEISFTEYLQQNKPYLTCNELLDMEKEGLTLGAHSIDHPLFNELDDETMLHQTMTSLDYISERFNQQSRVFSFPFTDFGIESSFFSKIFDIENPGRAKLTFGTAGLKREKITNHLQRIPVEDYTSDMANILKHQYLYYLAKAPLFKNTIRR